ncbi:MAG: hypothetical protein HOP34_15155 [Methylococcaceae bacterium]|nr:hypothetical protein [Methylococcaceae bacterium]
MIKLKLLLEQQRGNTVSTSRADGATNNDAPELPRNPYFQIHFQHIHDNIEELNDELQALRGQVSELTLKLDLLTSLLIDQHALVSNAPCRQLSTKNKIPAGH